MINNTYIKVEEYLKKNVYKDPKCPILYTYNITCLETLM